MLQDLQVRCISLLSCGILLALAIVCSGCAPSVPLASLNGTLMFEDKPVQNATVQLQSPQTGEAVALPVDANGKFQLTQPIPVGEYNVMISPTRIEVGAGLEDPAQGSAGKRSDIPERYQSTDSSGLKFILQQGENAHDINLTKN